MSVVSEYEESKAVAEKPLLQVRNLCKYFPIFSSGLVRRQSGLVKAVDDMSFDLARGETLGIVGESGSGKTTAVRSILRAIRPTSGEVLYNGRDRSIDLATISDKELKPLRQQMQMIFQDPFSSLNPRMTVGDIIAEPMVIHRIGSKNEREEKVIQMLEKVGLKGEHRQRYPHAFSGGQRQRIGIARALLLNPDLVVADESVSALDVSVQAQVINLLQDLQDEFQLTYIFVAHDLSVVKHICDRVAVMYAGRLVELAPTEELFADPKHPYTRALLSAIPNVDPDVRLAPKMSGEVADPANKPPGCSFHPRCSDCFAPCDKEEPQLLEVAPGRFASCHLYKKD